MACFLDGRTMQSANEMRPELLMSDEPIASRQRWMSRHLSRCCLQIWLLIGLSLFMLSPRAAHAMSDKEAVDVTIDILVTAGQTLGVPLDKDVVKIVKDVVGCSVSKGSETDCFKNVVAARVLEQIGVNSPQAAGAAKCLVDGGSPGDCLSKTAIEALPKEAQPLANCVIKGGNVADCTAKAAVQQILPKVTGGVPPEVIAAVTCVIGGDSLEKCGNDLAKSCGGVKNCIVNTVAAQLQDKNPQAAEMFKCLGKSGGDAQACATKVGEQVLGPEARKQLDEINKTFAELAKINADKPNEESNPRDYPQQPLALYNMIKIAQGVRDNRIDQIILYGGSALYQVAAGIIINYFLPGMGPILGPVAAEMIKNHTVGIQQGFDAIVKGDPVGLAEAAAEWYATTYIVPTCGLIPEGEFKNITCGTVAKAINTIVGAAGDVARAILGVGEDFLKLIGVWDFVDNVASGIWNGIKDAVGAITGAIGDGIDAIFGGGDDKGPKLPPAKNPAAYFAEDIAGACLGRATARIIASRNTGNPGNPDTGEVLKACTNYYAPYFPGMPYMAQVQCQKLVDGLNTMSQAAADNLVQAAKAVTNSGAPAIFIAQVYAQNRTGDDGGDHGEADLCSPDFWTKMNAGYAKFCANQLHTPMKDGTKRYPDSFRAGNVSDQTKLCKMPNYSGATDGACFIALKDFTKEQADKEAKDPKLPKMVGPDSALCKMQKKNDEFNAAFRPNCDLVGAKPVDAGGKVIVLPRGIECDSLQTHFPRPGRTNPSPQIDTTVQAIPYNPKIDQGVSVINYRPIREFSPVPRLLDPPQLQLPRWPNIGVPTLPVLVPANSGGSGGADKVDGRSGNSPVAGPSRERTKNGNSAVHLDNGAGLKQPNSGAPDRKQPRVPIPVVSAPNDRGSGSFNTTRPGGSAMDRLGDLNTGNGLGSVTGSAGGPSLSKPPIASQPGPKPGNQGGGASTNPSTASRPSPKPGDQGRGGADMVNGQSGNAPVKPKSGTSTNAPAQPSAPARSGFSDGMMDYGGCSGCSKPKGPVVR